jgi:hypothetical protein
MLNVIRRTLALNSPNWRKHTQEEGTRLGKVGEAAAIVLDEPEKL